MFLCPVDGEPSRTPRPPEAIRTNASRHALHPSSLSDVINAMIIMMIIMVIIMIIMRKMILMIAVMIIIMMMRSFWMLQATSRIKSP